MPAWNDLTTAFSALPSDAARAAWVDAEQTKALTTISSLRGDRNVLSYGSAFLQKPQVPASHLSITHEDVNGLMSVIHGMDWSKGLTLLVHTPGGVTNAAESIVAYLRSKFDFIEVIVPTFAMSAGTMISLAADLIVMGRQSQLGPIDPQMNMAGKSVSARAVVEEFERAKLEILGDATTPGNLDAAHVWAPILNSLGPSLLQEAQNALDYSEQMVAQWLAQYMFKSHADASVRGAATARHFNDASTHKSHGRRIGRDEARAQGVCVEDLEDDQVLQEAVLTYYHLMTIGFENGPTAKIIRALSGQTWVKNFLTPEEAQRMALARQQGGGHAQQAPSGQPPQNRAQRRNNR